MKTNKPLVPWGWLRAIIYLVVFLLMLVAAQLLNPLVKQLVSQVADESLRSSLGFVISYTLMLIAALLTTVLAMALINRQSWRTIGFRVKGCENEAGVGLFAPLAILSTGTLILIATKHLSITSVSLNGTTLVLQCVLMIMVAFTEELIFRGYILSNLMDNMNKWLALAITSILFALVHLGNPNITPVAIANIVLGGLILGLNFIYTRSLVYSVVFHFVWNFVQGAVLGYDVSGLKLPGMFTQVVTGSDFITGGPFGFEGSFVCLVLLVLAIVLLLLSFERKYKNALTAS